MKRVFDFCLALSGIVILFPAFVIVSLALLITQGWPIFFVQNRVGQYGKVFKLLKFRSMKNNNQGTLITLSGDNRITSVGKIIRKLKIDELPQLFNVLFGQMSFVGPRPEVLHYVNMYTDEQRRVLSVKPGITDPASLGFFDENEILKNQTDVEAYYIKILMPQKIKINLDYSDKAGFFSDLMLIGATVLRIFGIKISLDKFIESTS